MVTLGSVAVKQPDLFKKWLLQYGAEKIILGADVKDNRISVSGWKEDSQLELMPFLTDYTKEGVSKVLCTDISQDGMLQGPSIELYKQVMKEFPSMHLIASGGVKSIDDILLCKQMNLYGVICGKSIYSGTLDLREAIKKSV